MVMDDKAERHQKSGIQERNGVEQVFI